MDSISGIYKIVNKTNGNMYIGSAMNINRRWELHISELQRNKHHSLHLQNAWNKYGKDNFEFCVLEYCDISDLIKTEQLYFDKLNPKYNVCQVAGSALGIIRSREFRENISKRNKGRPLTEETKRKLSIAHTGKKRTFFYKHSEETRKKISSSLTGIKRSQSVIENLSKIMKGNKIALGNILSDETKKKMSISRTGKTPSQKTKNKIAIAMKKIWKQRKDK